MDMMKLILSALAALAVGIPFHLLMARLGLNKSRGQRILEAAKKAGRKTTGKLVKAKLSAYMPDEKEYQLRRRLWHVTYEYEVNQRTYKYRGQIDGRIEPPQEMDFYYPTGHPEKAMPEEEIRYDTRDISIVLFPAVLWVLFYWVIF